MIESNFSEECPHCGEPQLMRKQWEAKEYPADFTFDCTECGKGIDVTVHSVPEFEASKQACQYCNKVEVHGRVYCDACQKKLDDLSEFNRQRAESAK